MLGLCPDAQAYPDVRRQPGIFGVLRIGNGRVAHVDVRVQSQYVVERPRAHLDHRYLLGCEVVDEGTVIAALRFIERVVELQVEGLHGHQVLLQQDVPGCAIIRELKDIRLDGRDSRVEHLSVSPGLQSRYAEGSEPGGAQLVDGVFKSADRCGKFVDTSLIEHVLVVHYPHGCEIGRHTVDVSVRGSHLRKDGCVEVTDEGQILQIHHVPCLPQIIETPVLSHDDIRHRVGGDAGHQATEEVRRGNDRLHGDIRTQLLVGIAQSLELRRPGIVDIHDHVYLFGLGFRTCKDRERKHAAYKEQYEEQ